MHPRRSRWIKFFTFAAFAYAAFGAPQTSAQNAHPLVAECRAALDDSTAEERCSALAAHAISENSSGGPSHTCWVWGSCSLTVPVDGFDTSFQVSVAHGSPLYLSPSDLRLLDFCFARAADAGEGQNGWTMNLKPGGCASGEIDSDTAMTDGLQAPE